MKDGFDSLIRRRRLGGSGVLRMSYHKDDDPDKTKEEYDADNHADQLNSNNDEYDQDD